MEPNQADGTHLGWQQPLSDADGEGDHILIRGTWTSPPASDEAPVLRFVDPSTDPVAPATVQTDPITFVSVHDEGVPSPDVLWGSELAHGGAAAASPPMVFDETHTTQTVFS